MEEEEEKELQATPEGTPHIPNTLNTFLQHRMGTQEKSNTPFSYMLCLFCKKTYRELNMERALDKDTGVFSFFFSFLSSSSPLGQTAVSGISTLHQ